MAINKFVRLNTNIVKWEWYTDIPTKVLFFHLIIKVNFIDGNFKGTVVKRGQTITSSQHLADETGLTRQQVRTALDKLLSTNEITSEATNHYTLITLTNYETYNPQGKVSNTPSNPRDNQPITNEQPTDNQRITTIEEEEERKEEKDKYSCDSREWKLSTLLLTLMTANNPKTKTPNLMSWCDEISRTNKIDGHSMDDIEQMINWSQQDAFWKTNILSPAKLRKQFPQLWLKGGKKKQLTADDIDKAFAT